MYFFLGGTRLEIGGLTPADADAIIEGVGSPPTSIVNIGDWTADGIDDIAFAYASTASAGSGGSVTILESAAWTGTTHLRDLSAGSIDGGDYNSYFGAGIAKTPADLDGDGLMDLLIGDHGYDEDDDGAEGAVFVFYSDF
jgi:hypothetical protein